MRRFQPLLGPSQKVQILKLEEPSKKFGRT